MAACSRLPRRGLAVSRACLSIISRTSAESGTLDFILSRNNLAELDGFDVDETTNSGVGDAIQMDHHGNCGCPADGVRLG